MDNLISTLIDMEYYIASYISTLHEEPLHTAVAWICTVSILFPYFLLQ